jgi:hypothetical protein
VTIALKLVRRIREWPSVRIEERGACAVLLSGARDVPIAEVNVSTGALAAFIPPDLARSVVRDEPLLQLAQDRVRITLVDDASGRAAERLLRWRINLERFGPQLREASP